MSERAIDALDVAAQRLRAAMEHGDADRIAGATQAFGAALETLRSVGAWRANPALREKVRGLMARLASDKTLALLMGDMTRQQLDVLAGATPAATAPVTYGRGRQ
ncbi:MAG: hypothetical protein ABW184_01940 [Sphingobium sp.]